MNKATISRGAIGLAAVIGLLGVTACGGGAGGNSPESDAADDDASGEGVEGPVSLSMASHDQGSGFYASAVAISQHLENDLPAGSQIEVLPYAGGMGNPELVATGEAEIGLGVDAVTSWAFNGTEGTPFEGEPHDNLRVLVGGMTQAYFGPIVPADTQLDTLNDIAEEQMGVDMVSQPRGSQGEVLNHLILDAHGISVEDIEAWGGSFEATSTDVALNAVRDGNADLWINGFQEGHPALTELSETTDVRILDLSEDVIAALGDVGFQPATLPAGTFNGQDDEVDLVGYTSMVITTDELDDETAYAITETIIESSDDLRNELASMEPLDPERAFSEEATGGVELHPGAEAYYRDAGLLND